MSILIRTRFFSTRLPRCSNQYIIFFIIMYILLSHFSFPCKEQEVIPLDRTPTQATLSMAIYFISHNIYISIRLPCCADEYVSMFYDDLILPTINSYKGAHNAEICSMHQENQEISVSSMLI
ncbi:unnamed protein product [Amoebophrya sp. A25]|nr:unnamed protein product [Amoebophrya sp. A25]|eukprot:GSA25T00018885001.1